MVNSDFLIHELRISPAQYGSCLKRRSVRNLHILWWSTLGIALGNVKGVKRASSSCYDGRSISRQPQPMWDRVYQQLLLRRLELRSKRRSSNACGSSKWLFSKSLLCQNIVKYLALYMIWIEPGTLLGLIIYPSKFVGKESTSNW